ncbi:NB-ARC domain-containing protein [Streptomyces naphthomycinicus]|uniref:NB-ARC domain-containing protein n=1 Tax=Streptomyces naphthomycinicus TaxID=2872625 RepID=UPI001CEC8264|nr:NB-ARC domain-containing protein [Streptomyces sp. TML10]
MSRSRHSTLVVYALLLALPVLSVIGAIAVNVATSLAAPWPYGLDNVRRYPWTGVLVTTVACVAGGMLLYRAEQRAGRFADDPPPPPPPAVPDWVVERPAETQRVISALRSRRSRAVGITTALHGAGGFGKTTLADLVCADRRLRRHFGQRIYHITIGRDVRTRAGIAAKANEMAGFISGRTPTHEDPRRAGEHLGRLLSQRPRCLLVIDDVWDDGQLAPFLMGGRNCTRLVTTRVPTVLPDGTSPVLVDQMSAAQARQLLTWELPALDDELADNLLAVTGRWPLLLRLINSLLHEVGPRAVDVNAEAARLLHSLLNHGPAAVDGDRHATLDLSEPDERKRAVRATMRAGTQLLGSGGEDRFAELGIFAEDEPIPIGLVLRVWESTGGLDRAEGRRLCTRLSRLSLAALSADGTALTLHDVIRDYLRAALGPAGITACNAALVDSLSRTLPGGTALADGHPHPSSAWWELDEHDDYLSGHLVAHLRDAGAAAEAEAVAGDLRWAEAQLLRSGPSAVYRDLARIPGERATAMAAAVARAAHLLTPTDPPYALIDALHTRLGHTPGWDTQVPARRAGLTRPALFSRWPLTDVPAGSLRRTLSDHRAPVCSVSVAPDGSWLVSAGYDKVVSWDTTTGRRRRQFFGHEDAVRAVAVSPDGTRLATASGESIRLWAPDTGGLLRRLPVHDNVIQALAFSPDGTTLVEGGQGRRVRLWEVATGRRVRTFSGPGAIIRAVTFSPDGSWLAAGCDDGTVWTWNTDTGEPRLRLTAHQGPAGALAAAPDGAWLVTGGDDGVVRVWDARTGTEQRTLGRRGDPVYALVFSADGTWLAAAGRDGQVRLWQWPEGGSRTVLSGHRLPVRALAADPAGAWLASGGDDNVVHLWNTFATSEAGVSEHRTERVSAVSVHADGASVATVTDGGVVRRWDAVTGASRSVGGAGCPARSRADDLLAGLNDPPSAPALERLRVAALAPHGGWAAGALYEGGIRLWDSSTGRQLAVLRDSRRVRLLVIAPDGTWIAGAGHHAGVHVWSAATGRRLRTLGKRGVVVTSLAVAPDGILLASGGQDGSVRLWNTRSGVAPTVLAGHTGAVTALDFAPDGTWLAGGSDDGTVLRWDARTGAVQGRAARVTPGVTSVAISPDGAWLATCAQDQALRVWDAMRGECLALIRLGGPVTAMAWLPAGASLAVGGERGLHVFDFSPGSVRRVPAP